VARTDSQGLFWVDLQTGRNSGGPIRDMPKIKSKWRATRPEDWPNLRNERIVAIDTETFDPDLKKGGPGYARGIGHIVGISVAVETGQAWYFPMRHEVKPKQNLDPKKVLQWAKDNLQTSCDKIGANIKYDIGWLREEGVEVGGRLIDIQDMERLIDENKFSYSLDSLARHYLKIGKISEKLYQWCARYYGGNTGPKQRANIYRAPPALVGPYAEADAWQPIKIWKKQQKAIKKDKLEVVADLEQRLTPMLVDMRFQGVRVDLDQAEILRHKLVIKERELQLALNKIAKGHVSFNSGNSIAKAFKRLKLAYPLTEAGNPSFVKMWLAAHPHKIAKLIIKNREISKLRSAFVEGVLLERNIGGRIYCSFNQLGARSGRFSSSNPNLQQIPSRTLLGLMVRRCFIPDYGCSHWWRYDYSQIEYRHLADSAIGPGSNEIREMYLKDPNTDYHHATTLLIYEIVKILLERKPTKTINFGLVYGMGKAKLIKSLGLSKKAGNKLFNAYHLGVPFVKATFEHYMELAATRGYISTVLGRRSRFTSYEQSWDGDIVNSIKEADRLWGRGNYQRAMTHKALNRRLQVYTILLVVFHR